ncbi:MAG: hypothetical protein LBE36_05240 [Flavobacteriaceae bacterium]|jgi:hypothetical protein|nr:hypothetical protein [Flavobacteriaceae bacterium]
MTSFWLFTGKVFVWSFQLFESFGNLINWVLFAVGSILFIYWCWKLAVSLGGNRDKPYQSPSKEIRPYYDPKIHEK